MKFAGHIVLYPTSSAILTTKQDISSGTKQRVVSTAIKLYCVVEQKDLSQKNNALGNAASSPKAKPMFSMAAHIVLNFYQLMYHLIVN